jgi:hypothetical protein
MNFHSTHVSSMKKADITVGISQLVGLSVTGHIIAQSVQTRKTLDNQFFFGLQGNESFDAPPHVQALSCSYISCLK